MKKIWFAFGFAAIFSLVCLPRLSALELTLSHDPAQGDPEYTLSWTPVEPSTTDAQVTYYVFQQFGLRPISSNVIYSGSNIISTTSLTAVVDELSVKVRPGPGSRSFIVVSHDSVSSQTYNSNMVYHPFIHYLQGENLIRNDGDGTQRGIDQKWTFEYSLDQDAYVTAKIYPPGTQFTVDSNGFIVSASSPVVKTLVDFTPRSGEMAGHNITMSEVWDSRSSTGVVVPNGIYYLVLQAWLDTGYYPGGVLPDIRPGGGATETYLRDGQHYSIPVDILRILDLETTGLTLNSPTARITYTLTGDAIVRVLIAQPGTGFTVDGNGDVQPTNRTTGAIDTSLIISTFSYFRKAGVNYEAWNGISSTGAVVPSGIYGVGISAVDSYGNKAIDVSGNDYPIFTTVTLERSQGSTEGVTTVSDIIPPTLVSITPEDQASLSSSVSTITIVLADSESQLNWSGTRVVVLGPNNTPVFSGAPTSNNGGDTAYLVFSPPLEVNGVYNISIDALDTQSNPAHFESQFSINIGLAQGEFENNFIVYPNPAKNTTVTFSYTLSVSAAVEIEIFNILGEKVYEMRSDDTVSSGNQTFLRTWNLRNASGKRVGSGVYLVHIKASGSGSKVEATKKLVVIQ